MDNFNKMNYPPGFYVYIYYTCDNTPYYIGKGSKDRAWSHSKNELTLSPDSEYITIYKHSLSEDDALDLEVSLIAKFGRLDEGTGILHNKTPGGDKPPSQKGRVVKPETRAKISKSLKGRPSPKKGTSIAQKTKDKIKKNHVGATGKTWSAETKAKISKAMTGKFSGSKHWASREVITPIGEFKTITEAAQALDVVNATITSRCNSKSLKFSGYYFKK